MPSRQLSVIKKSRQHKPRRLPGDLTIIVRVRGRPPRWSRTLRATVLVLAWAIGVVTRMLSR